MVDGQAGKGDRFRRVNKKLFDHNYLKIFGVPCSRCNPKGLDKGKRDCINCGGDGYIPRSGNKFPGGEGHVEKRV